MLKNILISALIVAIFQTAKADPKELILLNRRAEAQHLMGMSLYGVGGTPNIKQPLMAFDSVLEQKLDHNSPEDKRTFSQRYWVNKAQAKNESSATLFYICGEGACSANTLYFLSEQATKLSANVVALEHRYYGKSQPFSNLKTENLKYLTVEQALKDAVAFKKFAEENFKFYGPWIVVGGSYPGALSAYARTLYPNEFLGSLASSAPVQADLDFSEYDRHVAKIAGPKCLKAIQRAVNEIEGLLDNEKAFEEVKAQFEASILKDKDDFLYLIADTAAAAIQYGMRDRFCSLIESKGRNGYAEAAKFVSELFGNLANMSAQAAENTSLEANSGEIGMRQWFYQSCTEFGFWQNAWPVATERARSARINSSYHQGLCKRLFNIDAPAATAATNQKYYAPILESKTANILFTNGLEDPWINLSITEENNNHTNKNVDVMVIEGAAHCDDLDATNTNPSTQKARKLFVDLSLSWLTEK